MSLRQILLEEITALTRHMRTVFDARVRVRGLTLARARILLRLKRAGEGETQKRLADALDIEAPTLVRLLDSLEEAGSIARIAVEGDRRAKGIVLTESGEAEADALEDTLDDFRSDLLAGIDEKDLDVTLRVIRQMLGNLETMA
ncbi:MarR family winged helix-turn-helix transcriptional regulator [Gellertiella hungarica]|uniref:MarR family transcriptional regulator for hemolysin n=1 Tax=Gellertiella hungarica TaxID=1572859 RepID=A0A7W6J788_9HYPH|nr:MarR family transcriptional regulator [Gellertiella hungarica]MBB4066116.1 MarR family transcriptional regulator for hemolysin [Gellertiella hungarica]